MASVANDSHRMISGKTTLVGLLGDPVAGSLSPRMQNAAFAAAGLETEQDMGIAGAAR